MRISLFAVTLLLPSCGATRSQLVRDSVHSAGLENNPLGDPATRELLIYLPPSYGSSNARRYPVLYFLHGTTSKPSEWIDGTYDGLNLQFAMDSLIAARTIQDFIVVMPDADNQLGGAFYLNSQTNGRWADFISRDVIRHVDSEYRTIPDPQHRVLAGHSMGGFGALILGLQEPDRFGLLYAMSPCCTLAGSPLINKRAWHEAVTVHTWNELLATSSNPVIAFALAFSPSTEQARRYGALPFEPDSAGQLRPDANILEAWQRRLPARLARNLAQHPMRPFIHLELGSAERARAVGAMVSEMSAAFDSFNIAYTSEVFEGDHLDRVRQRISHFLLPAVGRFFSRR